MKFAAVIEYAPNKDALRTTHAARREYLRRFLDNEQLRAAGPSAKDAGALWVLDAGSAEEANALVATDPLVEAGVIVGWTVRPLS